MIKRIDIHDIDLSKCGVILNKAGRVVDGINHGRMVLKGDGVYYKIFDKDYCRRENFIRAYEVGFFDGIASALQSLIVDGEDIIGYVSELGEIIGSEFDEIPKEFYERVLGKVKQKNMFFYDLVPLNIIRRKNGELSLIDLESVYNIDELHKISKHNAKVKPQYYYTELEKLWKKNMDERVISFIQPSRNNLKYLKWSYNSIRKHLGYRHEICWADDFSDDGTWEWMNEIVKKDKNVQIYRNNGPERLGHTILYDTLVDMASNDIVMIYHADMYACPGMDKAVLKHLERGKVVSATRIEPPLHPDGPEKILEDFGIEPEEFKESRLLEFIDELDNDTGILYGPLALKRDTSQGIFAPWAIYKDDFLAIGGHDPLYAPQSKEDSDIFNRFVLAGYETIQTWRGFVYHMTCRGSRFAEGAKRNPEGEVAMIGRETDEWLTQNERSTRNFSRKWSSYCLHDDYLKPYIQPKYDIGYIVKNCDINALRGLEPWSDGIFIDNESLVEQYIKEEQPNTKFNLKERLSGKLDNDIIVEFDVNKLNQESYEMLIMLPEIIKDSGKIGEFTLGIFEIKIKSLKTYEKELIKCNIN